MQKSSAQPSNANSKSNEKLRTPEKRTQAINLSPGKKPNYNEGQ